MCEPPENLTVRELRKWLAEFGEKNKEHFLQNQFKQNSSSNEIQNSLVEDTRRRSEGCLITHKHIDNQKTTSIDGDKTIVDENIGRSETSSSDDFSSSTITAETLKSTDVLGATKRREQELDDQDSCDPTSIVSSTTDSGESPPKKTSEDDVTNFAKDELYSPDIGLESEITMDQNVTIATEASERTRIVAISSIDSQRRHTLSGHESWEFRSEENGVGSSVDGNDAWADWKAAGSWHDESTIMSGGILTDDESEGFWVENIRHESSSTKSSTRRFHFDQGSRRASFGGADSRKKQNTANIRKSLPQLLCKSVRAVRANLAGEQARAESLPFDDITFVNRNKSSRSKSYKYADDVQVAPARRMHNANLFGNKMLTSSTLDFICDGKVQHSKAGPNFIPENGEEGTVSSWSEDSGQPSIAPNAVDARLSCAFEELSFGDQGKKNQSSASGSQLISPDSRTTESNGKNGVLFERKLPIQNESHGKRTENDQTNDGGAGFKAVIEKFGGGGYRRKTAVQMKKEQLERQWAASRPTKHVKKVKWQVCSESGAYKKTVIVDSVEKAGML